MPPFIDPDWEYYAPDPEIEEILAESAGRAGAGSGLSGEAGVRFGRGNPDFFRDARAPEPRPEAAAFESSCVPGSRASSRRSKASAASRLARKARQALGDPTAREVARVRPHALRRVAELSLLGLPRAGVARRASVRPHKVAGLLALAAGEIAKMRGYAEPVESEKYPLTGGETAA